MKKGIVIALLVFLLGVGAWFGWQHHQRQSLPVAPQVSTTVAPKKEIPAPPARSNPITDLEGNILSSPLNAYDN